MMRCEAERTKCHIKKGEHVMSSRTLNSYEKFLSNNDLLRVHRSHIVNVAHIRAVTAMDEMLFSDDSKVEVSRRRKGEVMNALRGR